MNTKTSKVEKLKAQLAEAMAAEKAKEKAVIAKQVREVSALVIDANLLGVPHEFLLPALRKIAIDYTASTAASTQVVEDHA